jgi:putative membrane protein
MWGYGHGWMMDYWGGAWSWMGPFGMILWLILLVLVVAAIAWFFNRRPRVGEQQRPSALDILEERYARGELGRDEYQQKRRDILGR